MREFDSRDPASFGFAEVQYRKADWVATVTINRPHSYNAYSTNALRQLAAAVQDAAFDDQVAVIVMTGAGHQAFCTGGDVKEYEEVYTARPRDYWKYMGLFRAWIESLVNAGKPVIARINGMAVGGGNESQLACDLAVMAEHAWLGQVGTRVGSVAAGGATQWLPIHIGDRRAREMLLLNSRIPRGPGARLGSGKPRGAVGHQGRRVHHRRERRADRARRKREPTATPSTSPSSTKSVADLVSQLLKQFPECQRYTKQQVNFWKDLSWHQTVGHARDWLSTHYTGSEPWEGMRAFVEKRPANYLGLREKAARGGSSEFVWGPNATDCPVCGAQGIPTGFAFCGACGVALTSSEARHAPDAHAKAGA